MVERMRAEAHIGVGPHRGDVPASKDVEVRT
jgi:hypothetical protein